jgi:hypothetical protein
MALCSLAIAAGVMGAVAIVKRLVFWRRFGGYGYGHLAACGPGFAGHGGGCGSGRWGWGGPRAWRRSGWGSPGGSFWLRGLFAKLDTTPGQEREIRSAIEDFQRATSSLRDGLRGVRDDVARAVSGEVFDDVAIGEAGARVDGTATHVKQAFADALRRIHGVLDARQRERLAELLAKGPSFGRATRSGSPYRDVL